MIRSSPDSRRGPKRSRSCSTVFGEPYECQHIVTKAVPSASVPAAAGLDPKTPSTAIVMLPAAPRSQDALNRALNRDRQSGNLARTAGTNM